VDKIRSDVADQAAGFVHILAEEVGTTLVETVIDTIADSKEELKLCRKRRQR